MIEDIGLKMLFSKKRWIHALSYEGVLLIVLAIGLSHFLHVPVEITGLLGVAMALISVVWNMIYNHYFEKAERKFSIIRDWRIRVLHALGFEGGLLLVTIPMIMYMLNMDFVTAFMLDVGLTIMIMFYTFIFQYAFDWVESKVVQKPAAL